MFSDIVLVIKTIIERLVILVLQILWFGSWYQELNEIMVHMTKTGMLINQVLCNERCFSKLDNCEILSPAS